MTYKSAAVAFIVFSFYIKPLVANMTIAVIGDMPYNKTERAMLNAPNGSLYKAIQILQPDMLLHLGDIKSGSRSCSDKRLLAAKAQITELLPSRTAYTPGDNEWTDCDRFSQNELERLKFIRKHFTGPDSGLWPEVNNLQQDKASPENLSWTKNNIKFITANIPGTNFGRNQILNGNKLAILDYANQRQIELLNWLQYNFEDSSNTEAIVIAIHADMFTEQQQNLPACESLYDQDCDAFLPIKRKLKTLIDTYQKPVLLIHGDTNDVCLEAFGNVGNAWRLNAAGDGVADGISVNIKLNSNQPFTAQYLLNETPVTSHCDTAAKL